MRCERHSPERVGVVLMIVLIAVAAAGVLALSFIGSQGTSLGIARNMDRLSQARALAESGLHMAIREVHSNASWRTEHVSGPWTVAQPFGAGTFSIVGQDGEDADGDGVVDGDGDLVDDPADPVTLTVTAAVDGVTHTVRAVARSAAEATAGYPEELDFDERHVQHLQIATQISASSGLTVTSISAYVDGPPPKKVRYAIYSDSGGEPGDLMAQTPAASVTQNGFHWLEVDLEAPTSLTPGTYWLALTFEQNNQAYKYDLGVGQVRFRHHDAVSDGFLPSWGTSATMGQRTISIFATGASFEESVGGSGNTAGGSGSTGLRVTWSEPGG